MFNFNLHEYPRDIGLDDIYADLCKSKEEMDAVSLCLFFIDNRKAEYHHACDLRPHDPKDRQKALKKLIPDAKKLTPNNRDLLMEWRSCYHWVSMVQKIKDDIFDKCHSHMTSVGMGKKKWLKLKPLLTKYLNHIPTASKRNFTREFEELQFQKRIETLLRSL